MNWFNEKKLWSPLLVLLALVLASVWYFSRPKNLQFNNGPLSLLDKRPTQIHTERVQDWSLLLDGKTFANQHHILQIGQRLHFTGHLHPNLSMIPPGADTELIVSVRPTKHKKVDEAWDVEGTDMYWEWGCSVITEQRIIDTQDHSVFDRHFDTGEYNARIYFAVDDRDAGKNTVDLLATATITIVAAK